MQVPGNEAPCRGSFSPKTRAVYLGSSLESDSGIMQIAAAGSRRPLLLRGHYCASSPWRRGSVQGLVLAQDTCSVLGELAEERQRNRADCRRRVA